MDSGFSYTTINVFNATELYTKKWLRQKNHEDGTFYVIIIIYIFWPHCVANQGSNPGLGSESMKS